MNKASSSFLIVVFAALLLSTQSFAQRGPSRPGPSRPGPSRPDVQHDQIYERVARVTRAYERVSLSELLRLSYQDLQLQVRSLSVVAESYRHSSATLELFYQGRPVATEVVRRGFREIRFHIPMQARISDLEFSSSGEVMIDTVRVDVDRPYHSPYPGGHQDQVRPQEMLTLHLNQHLRGRARLQLQDLVRAQLGRSLQGAEIERIIVEASSLGSRSPTVQVELNGRMMGQARPLPRSPELSFILNSREETHSLSLIINGDVHVRSVRIKVGNVRPGHQYPQYPATQRVQLNRQVDPYAFLDFSNFLGYDYRQISSVTIEARSLSHAQAQLILKGAGVFQGTIMVGPNTARGTIRLARPMMAHELRLEAASHALIQTLEIEYVR